jgi:DNA-binding SARP family transcriptional activator
VVEECVVRLRKVLGTDAIETAQQGYRLAIPVDDVDSRLFERLIGRGRELLALGEPERAAYLVDEALALWRGPPLGEVDGWNPGRSRPAAWRSCA